MTIPSERTRSVQQARDFLRDLLDPKKTPRVPRAIRERAYACLRHYPWDMHIDKAAEVAPDEWGKTEKK